MNNQPPPLGNKEKEAHHDKGEDEEGNRRATQKETTMKSTNMKEE